MLGKMSGALLSLHLTPLQEIKDLVTIVSLKIFFPEVIRECMKLFDDIPLQYFITILSAIYCFMSWP